jgi:carbon-monoxide dehydrogenase iron sulfur subunit
MTGSTKSQKRIVVHAERCVGCKACEIACAVAHSAAGSLTDAIGAGENPGYRIRVEQHGSKSVPIRCSHCENPECLPACPVGAITKDAKTGYVFIDSETCTGCRKCIKACPFDAIVPSPNRKKAIKCDMCVHLLAKGELPACVDACPTNALVFGADGENSGAVASDPHSMVYGIDADLCKGCGICLKNCPVDAISGEKRTPHVIDQVKCTKCGTCLAKCPITAVFRT